MGEVLILIIIALVWWFKAAVANEDKKVNDRETGSISASPDELIKKAKRTAEDLDALRGQTEKKRPSPTEIKALHKQHRADEWERNEQRHADERAHSEKRWEIARRKQADSGEVHSVHMDSCEDRLESLKVYMTRAFWTARNTPSALRASSVSTRRAAVIEQKRKRTHHV